MLAGLLAATLLLEPQRIDQRRQCGWLLPPAWIVQKEPGGFISYVGVPHGIELDGAELFYTHVHLHGGPAPVRRYLPRLNELVLSGSINPGKVFDLELPLEQVAEGYRAMDERRAIRTRRRYARAGVPSSS